MGCACGVMMVMCSAAAYSISFASPALVHASGAQPEMASFGMPEGFGVRPAMSNADFGFRRHQLKIWVDFWTKVMMRVPSGGPATVGAGATRVDDDLMMEYKINLIRTSPWAIPRLSRFRSCPDLPRFSEFSQCAVPCLLRRSASDGFLQIRRANNVWHLVDMWSPISGFGTEVMKNHQKFMMEQMATTMSAAHERALARGLLDAPRLPQAHQQLYIFVLLANSAAVDIGLSWHVTMMVDAVGLQMGIGVSANISALSQSTDLPFGVTPSHLAAIGAWPADI